MIPGARLVPLESRNPVLLENEAAWQRIMAEVRDFLDAAPASTAHGAHGVDDALAIGAVLLARTRARAFEATTRAAQEGCIT